MVQDVGAHDLLFDRLEGVAQLLGLRFVVDIRGDGLAQLVAFVVALGLGEAGIGREGRDQVGLG